MADIIRFVPRAEVESKLNLEAYVIFQREHMPVGLGKWDNDIWDTTAITEKRRQTKNGSRLYFRSWQATKSNASTDIGEVMPSPFKEFAKAYVAEVAREKRITELRRDLKVVQALSEATLTLRNEACVTRVDGEVLSFAAQLLADRHAYTNRWSYGRSLERLADRIKLAGLTVWHGPWRQPFKYQEPPRNDRVSKRADERVANRLPDVRAILALADIYHHSTDDRDKIPATFAALAMVAPERAGEILTLPLRCITAMDRDGQETLGLRWSPLKGGQPKTNWAITHESADVIHTAIDYLERRGAKAREAAQWYANHPDQLFLPTTFEHLRGQPITLWEASQIIGRATVPRACKKQIVFGFTIAVGQLTGDKMSERSPGSGGHFVNLYAFEELEQFILKRIPSTFPIVDKASTLHYHNALWCLPANVLRPDGDTLEYVPDLISPNQINHQLGANPGGVTVFTRHNKVNDNGQPWEITTHQFRHLLNTLAQSKYLSQELIAFWSGRKHVPQNAWYNHIPQEAFIEAYLRLDAGVPEIGVTGPLDGKVNAISEANAITRKDAMTYEIGSTHITRYGICRHDYSLTPCLKDKDCVMCGEHLFVKGDERQINEAKEQVQLLETGIARAEAALNEGRLGAKRWLERNYQRLQRWQLALKLLTDPSIENGTLITLPKPEVSQSKTGLAHAVKDAGSNNIISSDHELLELSGMV